MTKTLYGHKKYMIDVYIATLSVHNRDAVGFGTRWSEGIKSTLFLASGFLTFYGTSW